MSENGRIRLQYFSLSVFNRRPVCGNGATDRLNSARSLWIGSSADNPTISGNVVP